MTLLLQCSFTLSCSWITKEAHRGVSLNYNWCLPPAMSGRETCWCVVLKVQWEHLDWKSKIFFFVLRSNWQIQLMNHSSGQESDRCGGQGRLTTGSLISTHIRRISRTLKWCKTSRHSFKWYNISVSMYYSVFSVLVLHYKPLYTVLGVRAF